MINSRRIVAALCLAAILVAVAMPFAGGLGWAIIELVDLPACAPAPVPIQAEQPRSLIAACLVRATSRRAPPVPA